MEAKTHVLVVDDDIRILKFLRISLKLAGFTVTTASSGQEALNLTETEKPDIMLLDILMSPMDGFEVLKRLRLTSELPVLAVSAHSSVAQEVLRCGATDFMGKPFRPEDLVKRIVSVLSTGS